jgi:NAD(P)-dependent dehydrogenase (short-subunit alcohol dehydrogenase family)
METQHLSFPQPRRAPRNLVAPSAYTCSSRSSAPTARSPSRPTSPTPPRSKPPAPCGRPLPARRPRRRQRRASCSPARSKTSGPGVAAHDRPQPRRPARNRPRLPAHPPPLRPPGRRRRDGDLLPRRARDLPGHAVYGATKAAVSYLASARRAELAPRGIRVTAVEPGSPTATSPTTSHTPTGRSRIREAIDSGRVAQRGLSARVSGPSGQCRGRWSSPVSGHLTACARRARKDGVCAQDPTCVPAAVPPRGGRARACRPHAPRAV